MNKSITHPIALSEKIGYSMGDGAANLIFQMMMMFQLFFYTDVFGIKATAAGMILLVARIADAFIDPLVGILSDRTNTRWGKYRPWLLWTAIPFALFFILAFTTPDLSERGKILYAGITYTLLMAIYSFNNTPYSSLSGVMTSDSGERTSISTIRFITATIATFIVQGLTLPLVAKFGGNEPSKGWLLTVSVFALIGVVMIIIAFFSTRERVMPPPNQSTSIKQDLRNIFSSTPWRAMFVVTLFLFITLSIAGSSMSYYFNYYVDKEALFCYLQTWGMTQVDAPIVHSLLNAFGLIVEENRSNVFAVGFSLFNMVTQLVTLVGVLFISGPSARRFGKRNTFIVCLLLTALVTAMFYVVEPDDISTIFLLTICKSLAYAPTIPLLWAMMGDVADHSEWINHRRATGFVFAGIVFALKAGLGVGGAICGIIVDSFGFVPNIVQSERSLQGIRLTTGIIPAATFLICVIALFFYPITKQVVAKMQQELYIRRAKANSQQ